MGGKGHALAVVCETAFLRVQRLQAAQTSRPTVITRHHATRASKTQLPKPSRPHHPGSACRAPPWVVGCPLCLQPPGVPPRRLRQRSARAGAHRRCCPRPRPHWRWAQPPGPGSSCAGCCRRGCRPRARLGHWPGLKARGPCRGCWQRARRPPSAVGASAAGAARAVCGARGAGPAGARRPRRLRPRPFCA